jgi:molybdopterin converting factor small subunit
MKIRVVFYGRLKALSGTKQQELTIESETTTIQAIVDRLVTAHPALQEQLPTVAFTIGADLVGPHQTVRDGDEVGFLPPVSGGSQGILGQHE